jgi:hypothetical protein
MDLKPYNEQEFNRLCAEFLGWKQNSKKTTFYVDKNDGRYIYEIHDLKFHSDWNWIHEVVDSIDKLEFFSFHIEKQPFYNLNLAQVNVAPLHPYGMSIPFTSAVHRESKKEAVVEAIWEFLQLDIKLKNDI